MGEHRKNARPSSQQKHEEGQTRVERDKPGGESGDKRREHAPRKRRPKPEPDK